MVKNIPSKIEVFTYKIKFTYQTVRGNEKEQERLIKAINMDRAKEQWYLWIWSFNEKQPYRAMSNAKILDVAKVASEYIEFN